jgi:hypothetical protein
MIAYPNGFCHVVTADGQDGGLGFHCTTCHLQYRAHAPKEIRHCGRVEIFKPGFLEKVPTVKLHYGRERLVAARMIEV